MPAASARIPKIRLDELLVARELAETRSQAQRLIMAGQVFLNDEVADKPGRSLPADAPIRVQGGLRYVSRGGLKLEAALDVFGVEPIGWVCADIGASTGGFTDCLLARRQPGLCHRRGLRPVSLVAAPGHPGDLHRARQHPLSRQAAGAGAARHHRCLFHRAEPGVARSEGAADGSGLDHRPHQAPI